MAKTEIFLKKDNIQSFIIKNEIKNNNITNTLNQNELSQLFNNLYDSNFLVIINEVSSQIQSFYKSSIIQFSIIKSLLSQNENKDIPNISKIQNSFNNIELLFMQFYSTAKILFKKMKVYRSEKLKNIRHYSLNNVHKKQTITFNKDNIKIPLLNLENLKDNNNNNLNNIPNGSDSARTPNNKKLFLDRSNESNFNSNNSNNFSQSCNTTIDKESKILLIEEKNQNSNPFNEYLNNCNSQIKGLEEIILSSKHNKEDEDKLINIINSIKKMNNSLKGNISSFNLVNENLDKKIIINNLSNKINLLIEENNKIKKQFEQYKSDEKVKRKFFENQIFSLTNKNSEYKKNKDNILNEMNNKYKDISNLYIEIKNINSKLNEEIKLKVEKINNLQNILEEKNKINEYLINFIKEHNIEKQILDDNINQIIKTIRQKDKKLKELSIINNINITINQTKTNLQSNIYNKNNSKDNYIITPDNYSIIKIYQYNNKLKWILFKKNRKHVINFKRYNSLGNKTNTLNSKSNKELIEYNYNDFIWVPYKAEKDFSDFGDISLFIEKEKEYNNLIMKLDQKNKIYEKNIEQLQIENYNLNNIILKYKREMKDDIGISIIDDELDNSKFIDDKGCEEILTGLNKNKEIKEIKEIINIKNKNNENLVNINLKNNIDILLTKVQPSENIYYLLSSILMQLGCSEEDVFKLIGNYKNNI